MAEPLTPTKLLESLRTLHVGGTALGAWPALAESVAQALAATVPATQPPGQDGQGNKANSVAPHGVWRVVVHSAPPAGHRTNADARWLVFVESPAMALKHALGAAIVDQEDGELRPVQQQALQTWRASARRWLDHAQARRSRCLLVDTAEAMSNPEGLAAVLAGWLDEPLACLAVPAGPAADPLLQMLAAAAASPDRRAADLHAELLASCLPLPGQPEPEEATALEASEALRRCLRLTALEAVRPAQEVERAQLMTRLHETQLTLEQTSDRFAAEFAAASRQLQEANQRIAVLSDQLQRAEAALTARESATELAAAAHRQAQERLSVEQLESALRIAQLHQAQEELEGLYLREAQAVARGTAPAGELQQVRDSAAALQAAVEHEATAHRQAQAALAATRADVDRLQIRSAQMQQALEDRLHAALQAQETLALQLYEAQPGSTTPAAVKHEPPTAGHAPRLRVEEVRVVQTRDAPPHRELVVELEQLGTGGHCLPRLTAKLVEHEGRPGLALLSVDSGNAQALGQWQPTGTEDGHEIELLIPSDGTGRERLERLGTSDWQTVLGLVQLLESTVVEAGPAIGHHWPVVAARLRTQLLALRPRLRYDRLEVSIADGVPLGVHIRLDGVLHGERPLAPICLRWRPEAASDRLVWVLDVPDVSSAALGAWPILANGTLAPEMPLPVGPGQGWLHQLRRWATLAPADRDLLLALMDTLPAASERFDASLAPGLSLSTLRRAALSLRTAARRTATAGRLSQMAYSAARRSGARR